MAADGPVSGDLVRLLRPAEGVAEIRLNRPAKLNALNEEMYAGLLRLTEALAEDRDIRAVILGAEGGGFCAGSDVGGMLSTDLPGGRARLQRRHRVVQALAALEKPVIASVRGAAAGIGGSLAMACDMIVASETAYFTQAFRNVGLVPDGGAVFFLMQRLGTARAKDLIFTARRLPAAEALDWGLVARVVPDAELESATLALAVDLAAAPTFTLALAKRMMAAVHATALETALEIEGFAASVARASEDHREGVTAFREKRRPSFKGR